MTNQWNVTLDKNGALQGEEAYKLFLQGKDAWNAFIDQNPKTFVNFYKFDFSHQQNLDEIDFSAFRFPAGTCFNHVNFGDKNVSFMSTTFDDGDTSFNEVKFGNGNLSFEWAKFGKGNVSFEDSTFGDGDVSFERVKFGSGEVSFLGTKFGNGKTSFSHAIFNDGDVLFTLTEYGDGEASFSNATFGEGKVQFDSAKFSNSRVSFENSDFGKGRVSFDQTIFGKGNTSFSLAKFYGEVSFMNAEFNNDVTSFMGTTFNGGNLKFQAAKFSYGQVSFLKAKFHCDEVSFEYTKFGTGNVGFQGTIFDSCTITFDNMACESLDFSDSSFNKSAQPNSKTTFSMERAHISKSLLLPNLDFTSFHNVSFRGTSIGTLFDIEGSQFGQLPDLTATTINGHFSVDRIHVDTPKIFTEGDSTKARRLKELAKKSEDRKTQLDMLALELDAMTATKQIPRLSRGLNRAYKWVSDYGRSIARPFLLLVLVWAVCTGLYANLSYKEGVLIDSAQLSLSQSLPFLSLSRTVTETSLTALYRSEKTFLEAVPTVKPKAEPKKQKSPLNNDSLEWVGLLQNLVSYILLFFIGLGIRNRFKL